ncbi:hypothetical protein DCMF_01500 [Candidatus Formimonas warabiya]|uniref:4Fe-4S ferredoxin-type domain-containing protein n=2 Tax=Formimonas warabiya TaxID=1761012 RepID=A0A3G1L0I5_FORW1|nr:hypothetical protein DCMF_01500 [Candidatus Formimonas warabiya]
MRLELAEKGRRTLCPDVSRISIGMATCGQIAGATTIQRILTSRQDWDGIANIASVGCLGSCYAEPLADVRTKDGTHYFYGKLDKKVIWHLIRAAQGKPPNEYLWAVARERERGTLKGVQDLEFIKLNNSGFGEFFRPQVRRVSARCGLIDPENLAEYAAMDGYLALERALFNLQPEDLINLIINAGLRGRGGAGFCTGQKLLIASRSSDPVRIMIANGDEGDPGAYMDRALLESDPHSILEGLILACYAIRASQAYIFMRHEYPLAVKIVKKAISDAVEAGIFGENMMGSGFSLKIQVVESAGSFVCGEETSMLQVMQNKRGEPYPRPPYPSLHGLYHHPTVINNVETLANIPWIVLNGAAGFREFGTEKSPGTKIFCLAGDVRRMGFIEVPLGISTQTIVEKIGGIPEKSVKALQIGGPSGGIISYRNFALDYETVAETGAMMGSGGLVILGKNRCMVDLARHLVNFMAGESCGKCTICREGLGELEEKLLSLTVGQAQKDVLSEIEDLGRAIAEVSLCGLGQTAAKPILTSLKDFRSEYEAHIKGRCPAVNCKPLIDFEIILPCRMCQACYIVCPSGAVTQRAGKERLIVDRKLCVKCWACYETCPFNFIRITSEEYIWDHS